jgi:carbonic anhydrase
MNSRILLAMIVMVAFTGRLTAQEAKPTPAVALERLKEGNARFVADKPSKRDVTAKKREELAKGQHPFAIILTCADSRVAPELLFDTGLGELFVLRVAGNIADPAVVGSIEYAVEHLHAPLIVVLGHESCGAVDAAISGKALPGDLGWLVKQVKLGKLPADKDAKLPAGVRNNVLAAAADVEARSKVIHEEVHAKKVAIVSGVYSLKTGKVEWLAAPEKKKASTTEKTSLPEGQPQAAEPIPAPAKIANVETIPAPASVSNAAPVPASIVGPVRFPRLRAIFGRNR